MRGGQSAPRSADATCHSAGQCRQPPLFRTQTGGSRVFSVLDLLVQHFAMSAVVLPPCPGCGRAVTHFTVSDRGRWLGRSADASYHPPPSAESLIAVVPCTRERSVLAIPASHRLEPGGAKVGVPVLQKTRYETYLQLLVARLHCPADDLDLWEEQLGREAGGTQGPKPGLKKSHSSPSLHQDEAPTTAKVKRNVSERRTYRKVIPRRGRHQL